MDQGRIAVVVLAAGGSSRLGQSKQLIPLGGRPLLEHVLDVVRRTGIRERYVVLGHEAEQVRQQVSLDGFIEINNPAYADGQSTSVVAAVGQVPAHISAIIFVLGDQPLQEPAIIDRLASSYHENPVSIIQPEFSDGPGNPVLIDRKLFPELAALSGDTGARPIIRERKDQIRRIDCSEWERPDDVDTPEDFERVRATYESMMNLGD